MQYCIYNAIRTPDGTMLWCKDRYDWQNHFDNVSNEIYMNDGKGFYVRRSINKVAYEDLSVWVDSETPVLTEAVRNAPFWRSFGKNKEYFPEGVVLSLQQLDTEHIRAILMTQQHSKATLAEKLLNLEYQLRNKEKE